MVETFINCLEKELLYVNPETKEAIRLESFPNTFHIGWIIDLPNFKINGVVIDVKRSQNNLYVKHQPSPKQGVYYIVQQELASLCKTRPDLLTCTDPTDVGQEIVVTSFTKV